MIFPQFPQTQPFYTANGGRPYIKIGNTIYSLWYHNIAKEQELRIAELAINVLPPESMRQFLWRVAYELQTKDYPGILPIENYWLYKEPNVEAIIQHFKENKRTFLRQLTDTGEIYYYDKAIRKALKAWENLRENLQKNSTPNQFEELLLKGF